MRNESRKEYYEKTRARNMQRNINLRNGRLCPSCRYYEAPEGDNGICLKMKQDYPKTPAWWTVCAKQTCYRHELRDEYMGELFMLSEEEV